MCLSSSRLACPNSDKRYERESMSPVQEESRQNLLSFLDVTDNGVFFVNSEERSLLSTRFSNL